MPPKKTNKAAAKKVVAEEKDDEVEAMNEEVKDDEDNDGSGRGKRQRREFKHYEPDDFTMISHNATIKAAALEEGRGTKLVDIECVKASIDKYKLSSDEFTNAYKFLFSRGVSNKKIMKQKLLEFNGYLPLVPEDQKNEQQEDEDENIETKYATKAFKMNVSQIKNLCEFFAVDLRGEDGKTLNKEKMIDRLLDFLSSPEESMVKEKVSSCTKKKAAPAPATKSKKKSPIKKRKSVTKNADPFSLLKDHKKGEDPSDAAIRQWVKAYIVCVDLDTATTKDAIAIASAKFGVEMKDKKARIKQLLGM